MQWNKRFFYFNLKGIFDKSSYSAPNFGYPMPILYEDFFLCVFFRVQRTIQNDFASQEDHGKGNNREQQWKKRNIICVYIEYKL